MYKFDYENTPVYQTYKTSFELDYHLVSNYMDSIKVPANKENIPSSIFALYHNWNSTIGKPAPGTIHLKQQMNYLVKPQLGDIFEVLITITEKYQKKGRDYLIFETDFLKAGTLYCKSKTTYLWGFTSRNR